MARVERDRTVSQLMEKLDGAIAESRSGQESFKALQKDLNDVLVGRPRFQKAVNEYGPERA
eukprot:10573147-Lingulodinium_polyedra.AAC.1